MTRLDKTYHDVFAVLKDHLAQHNILFDFKPGTIISDFESGLIPTISVSQYQCSVSPLYPQFTRDVAVTFHKPSGRRFRSMALRQHSAEHHQEQHHHLCGLGSLSWLEVLWVGGFPLIAVGVMGWRVPFCWLEVHKALGGLPHRHGLLSIISLL